MEKIVPDSFIKNPNWGYFWINSQKILKTFIVSPNWGQGNYTMELFFYMTKKQRQEKKALLTWNKKYFLSLWKGLKLLEMISDPIVGL